MGQKSRGMTGEEFFDYDFISLLGDLSLTERLDVLFWRHMMETHNVPLRNHAEDCVICFSSTTEKLIALVVEHQWNLDIDVLKTIQLNGPQFLMMSITELVNNFSVTKDKAKQIWKEKKQIHHEALQ